MIDVLQLAVELDASDGFAAVCVCVCLSVKAMKLLKVKDPQATF